MKTVSIGILGISMIAVSAFAQQQASRPFAELDRAVKAEPAGWAGDKSRLSTVFDAERRRLGDSFEVELSQYLDGDAEKHKWISYFLEEPSYLHGHEPLLRLSLNIKERALSLLKSKSDEESLGIALGLNVTAAVLSEKLHFLILAASFRKEADRLLAANPKLNSFLPFISEDDRKIYSALAPNPTVVSLSPTTAFSHEPKARVSGGALNGKATSLPMIVYPVSARKAGASGEVTVKIVFDENGKVIWARIVSAHPLLQKAVLDAAYQAKFQPVTLSGKRERVSGILIFRFFPQ